MERGLRIKMKKFSIVPSGRKNAKKIYLKKGKRKKCASL